MVAAAVGTSSVRDIMEAEQENEYLYAIEKYVYRERRNSLSLLVHEAGKRYEKFVNYQCVSKMKTKHQ